MFLPQFADPSGMSMPMEDEDPLRVADPAPGEDPSAVAESALDKADKERTMGRQHLVLYAFIGVFVAVLGSAMVYLAGRQGAAQPAQAIALPSKPATAGVAAVTPPVEVPKPAAVADPPPQEPLPASASAPPAQALPEAPKPAVPATAPALIPTPAVLEEVLPNRMYLQVGSLDKNVAEILTQGLRIKGIPATIAPGVTPLLSRIIVGPFQTNTEMGVVQKQLSELGFTPFPRQFQPSELHPPPAQNASAGVPPAKP
jgi:hypothetical protein